MKRYKLTYTFIESEEGAIRFCEYENALGTRYKRKKYPAHYTPRAANDGSFDGFICWYYTTLY